MRQFQTRAYPALKWGFAALFSTIGAFSALGAYFDNEQWINIVADPDAYTELWSISYNGYDEDEIGREGADVGGWGNRGAKFFVPSYTCWPGTSCPDAPFKSVYIYDYKGGYFSFALTCVSKNVPYTP